MSIEILRHPPKVSLLSYKKGTTEEKKQFIDQLFYGLKEFGSVLLTDHGIKTEKIENSYKRIEEFFSLTEENKLSYFRSSVASKKIINRTRTHQRDFLYCVGTKRNGR